MNHTLCLRETKLTGCSVRKHQLTGDFKPMEKLQSRKSLRKQETGTFLGTSVTCWERKEKWTGEGVDGECVRCTNSFPSLTSMVGTSPRQCFCSTLWGLGRPRGYRMKPAYFQALMKTMRLVSSHDRWPESEINFLFFLGQAAPVSLTSVFSCYELMFFLLVKVIYTQISLCLTTKEFQESNLLRKSQDFGKF